MAWKVAIISRLDEQWHAAFDRGHDDGFGSWRAGPARGS
jgi:hypothetical protein